MDQLVMLWQRHLQNCGAPICRSYLNGICNTLVLAMAATLIGCLIGLLCGILNTIPYAKNGSACSSVSF